MLRLSDQQQIQTTLIIYFINGIFRYQLQDYISWNQLGRSTYIQLKMQLSMVKVNFLAPNNTIYQATSEINSSDILPKQLVQSLMNILNLGDLLPTDYYSDRQCNIKTTNQYIKNGDNIYIPINQRLFQLWQQKIKENKKKQIEEKKNNFDNTAETKEELQKIYVQKEVSHYNEHEQDIGTHLINKENFMKNKHQQANISNQIPINHQQTLNEYLDQSQKQIDHVNQIQKSKIQYPDLSYDPNNNKRQQHIDLTEHNQRSNLINQQNNTINHQQDNAINHQKNQLQQIPEVPDNYARAPTSQQQKNWNCCKII